MAGIIDVRLGSIQVDKILCGSDMVYMKKPIDTTAPITSPRPYDAINNPANSYASSVYVYLDVNEPCDTYFTIDGSTPTISEVNRYTSAILIDTTTTLKYFSVDQSGNQESVKTLTYTIAVPQTTGYRYVQYIGYGDNISSATSRLVELQAMEGATNRLLNKVPISGEPVSAGGNISAVTDGSVDMSSGTYPLWWNGEGIPTLTWDMGGTYNIDTLKIWGFSTVNDPRQTKYILKVSKDNINWTTVINMSANTTPQPADGWAWAVV